jgi:CheY-like chemotaxis protein
MEQHRPLQGQHIVIVEDTVDGGLPLSTFLQRRGGASVVEVLASVNRAQARLLRPPRPTLVLIVHILSVGIGTTLAAWARQQEELNDIVLVSYSGQSPEKVQATCPTPDLFDAVFTKGVVALDELIAQLATLTRQAAGYVNAQPILRETL